MIWISVGVPVLACLCQAFLSLWYFNCHSPYFSTVSYQLNPGLLASYSCVFRASSIVLSDLFGHLHTSQDSKWIHLKITIYFAELLYREISPLVKFIAWLLKHPGWQNRGPSKMEKLLVLCETVLLPGRKTTFLLWPGLLILHALNLMAQRHILLPFTQSIQSCSMLTKGKRIL